MLQYMKYVYVVYKEKSFSKAAANLGISQPALSTAIKKVEREAGAILFDRSVSPLLLTEAGKTFILAVEEILSVQNDLQCKLNDMGNLKSGHLKIGGSNFFSSFILPHAISKFSKRHPGIQIDLIEAHSSQLNVDLLGESLDLVMDSFDFDKNVYTVYPVLKENVLVAVPRDLTINTTLRNYQLTAKDIKQKKHLSEDFPAVNLDNFKSEAFIFLRKGNDMGERALSLCHESGFNPRVIMYLDQLMTSYNVACMGMGIAFVTDKVIIYGYPRTEVVFYKINSPLSKRNIVFAHKKNRYVSQAMSEFISFSKDVIYKFNSEK
ncbi:MAG: LysR family transcriptional regulator [Anaerotignaceae bacterium]